MKTQSRTLETDAKAPSGAVRKSARPAVNRASVAIEEPSRACFFR